MKIVMPVLAGDDPGWKALRMALPDEEGGSRGDVSPLEIEAERNLLTGFPKPRGHLTELACPDCGGVLELYSQGEEGFWELTCRVGHSFSMDSLVSMKEDQIEKALWASVETFGELALLYRARGMRAEACGDRDGATDCVERAERAEHFAAKVREIVLMDGPVRPNGSRHAPAGA